MVEDEEIVEVRETHRRPNIQPFLDDLDCWLVASIEDYDLETNTVKPGPIGDRAGGGPEITSAADALAVVLNERGCIDIDHIAELLHGTATTSSLNSPAPFSATPRTARGRRRTPTGRMLAACSSAFSSSDGVLACSSPSSQSADPRSAQTSNARDYKLNVRFRAI